MGAGRNAHQAAAAVASSHEIDQHGVHGKSNGASQPSGRHAVLRGDPNAPRPALEDGPSEVTLIVYSVLMATTSLVFGGLSIMHAQQSVASTGTAAERGGLLALFTTFYWPSNLLKGLALAIRSLVHVLGDAFDALCAVDIHTLLFVALTLFSVLSIAFWTNPNDASFRSFLADQSLHLHLRHLRDQPPPLVPCETLSRAAAPESPRAEQDDLDEAASIIATTSGGGADAAAAAGAVPRAVAASPHVQTFATRISISLRTPPYKRRDFGLFSVVSVRHASLDGDWSESGDGLQVCARPARCVHCGLSHIYGDQPQSWYVGAFGRWVGGTLSCDFRSGAEVSSTEGDGAGSKPGRPVAVEQVERGVIEIIADGGQGSNLQAHADTHADPKSRKASSARDDGEKSTAITQDESVLVPNTGKSHKTARRRRRPQRLKAAQALLLKETATAGDAKASSIDHSVARVDAAGRTSPLESPFETSKRGPGSGALATELSSAVALDAKDEAQAAADVTALSAALHTSNTAIADLQAQLEHLRRSSDASRSQLQAQLDEMRSRKKEEDTTRLDLKERTKSLDESKRQAEGARREAEKRLRVATNLRSAIQKRIDAKSNEVTELRAKQNEVAKKLADCNQWRKEQIAAYEDQLGTSAATEARVKEDIAAHREKLISLEARLAQAEAAFDDAKEEARRRHQAQLEAHRADLAREESELARQHETMLRSHFVPSEPGVPPAHVKQLPKGSPQLHAAARQNSGHPMHPSTFAGPGAGQNAAGFVAAQTRNASREMRRSSQGGDDTHFSGASVWQSSLGAEVAEAAPGLATPASRVSAEFDGFDPTLSLPRDVHRLASATAATPGGAGGSGASYFSPRSQAFVPQNRQATINAAVAAAASASASASDSAAVTAPSTTSQLPAIVQGPPESGSHFALLQQAPVASSEEAKDTPERERHPMSAQPPITPMTPFSTDLLPSNLFLNQDDDERHQGILPGTRSERVEEALGRFGLDTSDTSDLENGGSSDVASSLADDDENRGQKEGTDSGLDGGREDKLGSPGDDVTDGEDGAEVSATAKHSRSWWGGKRPLGRDKRLQSPQQPAAPSRDIAAPAKGAALEDDEVVGKRRSLSIFPKLSLNPGAKSFNLSAPRQIQDGQQRLPAHFGEETPTRAFGGGQMHSPVRGPLDAWALGNAPAPVPSHAAVGTDYDAVRRAFEASAAAEEEGRRSWSVFDTWANPHRSHDTALAAPRGAAPPNESPRLAGAAAASRFYRLNALDGPAGARSSTDSLPHAFGSSNGMLGSNGDLSAAGTGRRFVLGGGGGGSGGGGVTEGADGTGEALGGGSTWPDELFSSLTRTSSHPSTSTSASVPRPSSRLGSRFTFWRDRDSSSTAQSHQNQHQQGTFTSSLPPSPQVPVAARGEEQGKAVPAESHQTAKRFPWSRRSESGAAPAAPSTEPTLDADFA